MQTVHELAAMLYYHSPPAEICTYPAEELVEKL
jgi:hypothetical protein